MTAEPAEPSPSGAVTATAEPPPAGTGHRGARWSARHVLVVVLVGLLLSLLVRTVAVQAFSIPSGSMEPTLRPGERVLVSRLDTRGGDVRRGDVVVFDGSGTFAPAPEEPTGLARVGSAASALLGYRPGEVDFVKRVVGLPGERISCCDPQGRLVVDGAPLDEPYLPAGEAPSALRFDIEVPAGRLWVMGDHRSASADSRAHLGDPGGGTVALDDVVGRVAAVTWPLGEARLVPGGAGR